jgi:hypothetical protein
MVAGHLTTLASLEPVLLPGFVIFGTVVAVAVYWANP